MQDRIWDLTEGEGPLVGMSLHSGHEVRDEVAELLALDEAIRFREEDPYTDLWTIVAETRIVIRRSRFEVDCNRPRNKAVYKVPEDAWGLKVWKRNPPKTLVEHSLAAYDAFYREAERVLTKLERRFGLFVVLDLHSYNHRRPGPEAPPEDPLANPEINIGTGSMDRRRWAPLVDRFTHDLRAFDFLGRHLEVRENVRFKGGHFARLVHEGYPESGCTLSIEVKKFFMDEWTGELDEKRHSAVGRALGSTVPGILEVLTSMGLKD